MASETKSTAERLGYAADARVLIINADDFGMCHDQNEGVIRGLQEGVFTSSTILVTCPWFEEAAEFARNNPNADLGVHLTLTAEWDSYKWGPVLGRRAVPSLVDERGYLWQTVAQVYEHARLDQAEAELREQIEKAFAAGIDATHLDSHMGTLQLRADYHEIYTRLANDYRLPLRLASRRGMSTDGMGGILEQLDAFGVVTPDHLVFNGPPAVRETESYWTNLLRTLKPGVTEILCHPALARDELKSCARDAHQREADFRYFTSDKTRKLIADEGVEMIGFRQLRDLMRRDSSSPSRSGRG
ncbi:MAG TPA: polysaccharide deacetylase family protein [Candidatus Binatus sp.]|uniref:polysaccharide deacetylase family protein n=1 Tax=Candidatus Binatus sp. TaxID=2811406 RepID=UPI002F3FD1FC